MTFKWPRRVLAILLMPVMAWIAPAAAVVEINDNVERYVISGATAAALRHEMNTKGPQGVGRRFDGFTKWHVSWRWRYQSSGAGCVIESVRTTVTVNTTLPRWEDEHRADHATQQRWARYLSALEHHEEGHRRNGVAAGHDIDQIVATMPPAASCDALGANANALGKSIIQKYVQRDVDYDRDTRHGVTQGAQFP